MVEGNEEIGENGGDGMNDSERIEEVRKIAKEIKERWNFEIQDVSQAQDDIVKLVDLVEEISTIYFASW